MAAEVLEQVADRLDGAVDVEALHRAARAGGQAVAEREHHRRLVVQLGEAACHDADDAFVPVFVLDYD